MKKNSYSDKARVSKTTVLLLILICIAVSLVVFSIIQTHFSAPSNPFPRLSESVENSGTSIIVIKPKSHDQLLLPFLVSGRARVPGNSIEYQIRDSNGSILRQGTFAVKYIKSAGEFGFFAGYILSVAEPKGKNGTIDFFPPPKANQKAVNKISIPIAFSTTKNIPVTLYFPNDKTSTSDCGTVFPVTRIIGGSNFLEKSVLDELLNGPFESEHLEGYTTSIPKDVTALDITMESGTVSAEFNRPLFSNAYDPCVNKRIMNEIAKTLFQFPSVQSIVLSSNGIIETVVNR